jgi:hypothetical protein
LGSAGGIDVLGWPVNNSGAEGLIASLILQPPALLQTGPLAAFELRGELVDNAPVPEPATIWLLTAGSAMLVGRLRKRK